MVLVHPLALMVHPPMMVHPSADGTSPEIIDNETSAQANSTLTLEDGKPVWSLRTTNYLACGPVASHLREPNSTTLVTAHSIDA